uniref:Thioredoxin domain-containing protein n=1 Tax=Steinernema glaseri TaxID=37863 RepID=A0A1I7ZLT4_9BILA
ILEGRVKLAKIDCDRHPGVCQTASVRAYPSIRLYLGGPGGGVRQDPQGVAVQSQHRDAVVSLVEQFLARRHDEL